MDLAVLIRQLQSRFAGQLGNQRIVSGIILLSGTTASTAEGTGFSVATTGTTGRYIITFDPAFGGNFSIVAMVVGKADTSAYSIDAHDTPDTDSVTVDIVQGHDATRTAKPFCFIAAGPA